MYCSLFSLSLVTLPPSLGPKESARFSTTRCRPWNARSWAWRRRCRPTKYDFAPTSPGTFTGVRTYALQVRHIATYIYRIAASVSGEKAPVEIGPTDNGPDTLKTKDQIIDYFKGALAFAHKAMGTLNEKNMYDQVPSPFGRGTMTRVAAAAFLGQHSYDHYGQMVVYARMNGVIPGGGPPPAGG